MPPDGRRLSLGGGVGHERQAKEQVTLAHRQPVYAARPHELAHADRPGNDDAGALGLEPHDLATTLERQRREALGQCVDLGER